MKIFNKILVGTLLTFIPIGGAQAASIINNCQSLQDMQSDTNADYELGSDIDCSGFNFLPIKTFTGSFDGNNHTIDNLKINLAGTDNVGLFGKTNGATISNVKVLNADITAREDVGILIGNAKNTDITNVITSGEVLANAEDPGGIVGFYAGVATIQSSSSSAKVVGKFNPYQPVLGDSDVGGLIGDIQGKSPTERIQVIDCFATGDVKGVRNVGGLAGEVDNADFINSYATGFVLGNDNQDRDNNIGGLLGYAKNVSIQNSYAENEVNGHNKTGGLVGHLIKGDIDNSHAQGNVTGHMSTGGLVGKSEECSTIIDSYAISTVDGSDAVGGLVGYAIDTNVEESYSEGMVTAGDRVGGLIGHLKRTSAKNKPILNVYSGTSAFGEDKVGGLIGFVESKTEVANTPYEVTNALAYGQVQANKGQFGGLIADAPPNNDDVTVTNSFYDYQTTGILTPNNFGTPKTTSELFKRNTFTGWDFNTIWGIKENEHYPVFQLINNAPYKLELSNNSIQENNNTGDKVADVIVSDYDIGDTHTCKLTSGDVIAFSINSDNELIAQEEFDFDNKQTYTITIECKDSEDAPISEEFTITVTEDPNEPAPNSAPTDITLSNSSIQENLPIGTVVGDLNVIDADTNDTHNCNLISGDVSMFNINASNQLVSNQIFDFDAIQLYNVTVECTDSGNLSTDKQFMINITSDPNEPPPNGAPTGISLSNNSIEENLPSGTFVGDISVEDPDLNDSHTCVLAGTDADSFSLDGLKLNSNQVFDYETKTTYSITLICKDNQDAPVSQNFTIGIVNNPIDDGSQNPDPTDNGDDTNPQPPVDPNPGDNGSNPDPTDTVCTQGVIEPFDADNNATYNRTEILDIILDIEGYKSAVANSRFDSYTLEQYLPLDLNSDGTVTQTEINDIEEDLKCYPEYFKLKQALEVIGLNRNGQTGFKIFNRYLRKYKNARRSYQKAIRRGNNIPNNTLKFDYNEDGIVDRSDKRLHKGIIVYGLLRRFSERELKRRAREDGIGIKFNNVDL